MTEARDPMLVFLEARIAEDETAAKRIQAELEQELKEKYTGMNDESGPPTPERILSGQLWAQYNGQSRTRNFAKGQYLARIAAPSRVLDDCRAKRAIISYHGRVRDTDGDPDGDTCSMCSSSGPDAESWPCLTLQALASAYGRHEEYRPEWEPWR